ncbi:hypothetical protein GCL60_04690 [Silvanigrella paludirubra]|uniref:MFS transporter n=1 Tax=Silvanigrella paludirubra TaxID=2499159 RepID=A0A6N6VYT7_9BACT|nr:MFS transporter [Silvanigrella paludirubra]KAB8039558.1 hypothetical protein GCL60_04690 [Silvanigrella paludirubra]
MIQNKYFSFFLLLLAESIERFSYFFVSFVLIFYMMTNIENGGLEFSQESAMNIGGYFSFGILVFPLIMAPMIDKYLGYFKAAIYGGIALSVGYLFAFLSGYLSVYFIVGALIMIVVGSAFIKPSISVLVGKLSNFSSISHDLGYILYVISVSAASMGSAYFSAKLINKYFTYMPFFVISFFCMLLFTFIIYYLNKNIKLNDHNERSEKITKKTSYFLAGAMLFCLFIGASTTISSKIFSFPNTLSFWLTSLFSILFLLFVCLKFLKTNIKMLYVILISSFFIIFLMVNLFIRNLGDISPILPGIFSSFDMLQNFFIFPIVLSIIAKYSPTGAQATMQSLAFFLFSLSTILVKNILPLSSITGSKLILILALLIIMITAAFVRYVYKVKE